MYPQSELIQLAARKAELRRVIARRRIDCAAATAHAMRPLVWLDRAVALWRKITPFGRLAAIPLAVLAGRSFLPRGKIVRSLLRWGPLAFAAIRSLRRPTPSP